MSPLTRQRIEGLRRDLTPREGEILRLFLGGMLQKDMVKHLGISAPVVSRVLQEIRMKYADHGLSLVRRMVSFDAGGVQ